MADPVNPVANNDIYDTLEDQILRAGTTPKGVIDNDDIGTGPDSKTLAAELVAGGDPVNPLFTINTDGSFTYDARNTQAFDVSSGVLSAVSGDADLPHGFQSLGAGAVVTDSFDYHITDGTRTSNTATATITITGENDAPVGMADVAIIDRGAGENSVTFNAVENDVDIDVWPTADQDDLHVTKLRDVNEKTGNPFGNSAQGTQTLDTDQGGTVTINGGQITYAAADGFVGTDLFEYQVADGNGGVGTAEVRIIVKPEDPVNVAPVAVDDTYTIDEDNPLVADDAIGTVGGDNDDSVLVNDTDADDNIIGAEIVSQPTKGLLTEFNSDGTFTYDPNGEFESLAAGESEKITFQYRAFDGDGASSIATVEITVTGVNDDPTASDPADETVYEAGLADGSGTGLPTTFPTGETAIVVKGTISASDPDGSDTLSIVEVDGVAVPTSGIIETASYKLEIDGLNYTYTLKDNSTAHTTQGQNIDGIKDSFQLTVGDNNGGTADPVTLNINIVDDIPFLTQIQSQTVAFAPGEHDGLSNLVPGADDADLEITSFTSGPIALDDGRTVTGSLQTDGSVLYVDSTGGDFARLELLDEDGDGSIDDYLFTMYQNPPLVINDIDFSAVKAGGPQEVLTVENISFDGFFYNGLMPQAGQDEPEDIIDNHTHDPGGDDDVNPNNAGGIGVGNGNMDQGEGICIDVGEAVNDISGIELEVKGVGGGVDTIRVAYNAYDEQGNLIESGLMETVATDTDPGGDTTIDVSGKDPVTLRLLVDEPFDTVYILPLDLDANDSVRINRVATLEQAETTDIRLDFEAKATDGDGDMTGTAAFSIGIDGNGDGTVAGVTSNLPLEDPLPTV